MIFWFIVIAVTAIACAALYHAAGPRLAGMPAETGVDEADFRLILAGIDADLAAGKLGEPEALAARGELAREILRHKAEAGRAAPKGGFGRAPLLVGLAAIAALSLGLYVFLGRPDLPAQPLAGREAAVQTIDLDDAIARIEAQLETHPDDLRAWTVIAPAYLEMGRYADAANAYARIMALDAPTADLRTRRAEALILASGEAGSPEAMAELRTAAAAEPGHVLSRLYLASELTRQGDFPAAIAAWQDALALSKGGEPWVEAARQGLAAAENGGTAPDDADEQTAMIEAMVTGLAERLAASGGSIEEWTQLVRAYLVLGDKDKAQGAFDAAVLAYPRAFDRGELDTLALANGLKLTGVQP
ncbi:c-type cytochrome biogenesis protein CcmI [Devosia sp.]|uniref:c-type cytochrome biogenesis protein CcmI n=1 Tax=Devosia sp. TaxID=1871048 RepID=UPI002AFDD525|nr:c-type cytochrome biogenesis protein CcmI [Devosia sp.]